MRKNYQKKEKPLNFNFFITIFSIFSLFLVFSISIAQESYYYDGKEFRLSKPKAEVVIPEKIPSQHKVIIGDTLWDISGLYFSDPFLWPLIWEINPAIVNPHLIFPDQKVILPTPTQISELKEVQPPSQAATWPGLKEGEIFDESQYLTTESTISKDTVESCGFIARDWKCSSSLKGSDRDNPEWIKFDKVYLEKTADISFEVGKLLSVKRKDQEIKHPIRNESLGFLIRDIGLIKLTCENEQYFEAEVVQAYQSLRAGDLVCPYQSREIPRMARIDFEPSCNPDKEALRGFIVALKNPNELASAYDIVYLDLGSAKGIVVGDYFKVYDVLENIQEEKTACKKSEPNKKPAQEIAILIALTTTPDSSTALILKSQDLVQVGQPVILFRK